MRLELRAHFKDEHYDVVTSLRDVIEWERKYRKQASMLGASVGMEDLVFLAWSAGKREKLPPFMTATFEDFINKLVNVEVVTTAQANPTE